MNNNLQDKQQDYLNRELVPDNLAPFQRNDEPKQSKSTPKPGPIPEISITKILNKYNGQTIDYRSIYKRRLQNGDMKEVFHINLKNNNGLVLKVEEFGSQRIRKYKGMYREYYVGKTLGAISKNIVETYDFQEIEILDGQKIRAELLTEYGGEDFLKNELKPGDSLKAGYQLLSALKLMEERGVSHLDIKPENVVWRAQTSCLKIIDFGTSISFYRTPQKIFEEIGDNQDRIIGFTSDFCPPELHVLSDSKMPLNTLITQKLDAFAYGLTFYEILLSEHKIPFKRNPIKDAELLNNFLIEMRCNLKKINHEFLLEILENCTSFEPKKRKTFAELFNKLTSILCEMNKKEAIQVIPEKIDYIKLAEKYEHAGVFDSATWLYELAIKTNSSEDNIAYLYNRICLVQIFQKVFKENNFWMVFTYYYIGITYRLLNNYEKAIYYIKKCEKIAIAEGLKYQNLAIFQSELAYLYNCVGNNQSSYEYLLLAEDGLEKSHWNLFCNLEKGYINVAYLLIQTGKYSAAIPWAKKALTIVRKNLGEDCAQLYEIYCIMGDCYFSLWSLEGAIENYNNAKQIPQQYQFDYLRKLQEIDTKIMLVYIQSGQIQEADKIVKEFTGKTKEEYANFYCMLGTAHLNYDIDSSINYFLKAKKLFIELEGENSKELDIIYYYMGAIYNRMKAPAKAIKVLEKAIHNQEVNAKGLKFYSVCIYNELGKAFCLQNDYNTSMNYFEKAVKLASELKVENNTNLYMNIGILYGKKGEWLQALKLYEKSELEWKKCYGMKEECMFRLDFCYGVAYAKIGNFQKSKEHLQTAEDKILEKYQGDILADLFIELAECLYEANEYRRSIFFFQKAENILLESVGDGCGILGAIYSNLGKVFYKIKEFEKALNYYKKAEEIHCKTSGKDSIIFLYKIMSTTYERLDDYDKSIEYLWKFITNLEKKFGFGKQKANYLVAKLYKRKGDLQSAYNYFNKSLEFPATNLGVEGYIVGEIYLNLGFLLLTSKLDDALNFLLKAETIYQTFYGNRHVRLQEIWTILPLIYGTLKNPTKSHYYNKKFNENKDILKDVYEEEALDVFKDLVSVYLIFQASKEALSLGYKTLELSKKLYGDNNCDVGKVWMTIGKIYCFKGDFKEGINSLNNALKIFLLANGSFHINTLEAYKVLEECNKGIKDFDKALECQNKIKSIESKINHY